VDAPQSGIDVESVVRELQLLDPLLNVRWEPKAVMETRGGYDAVGKVINPIYRGLWEIIRDDGQGTAPWRSWTRVCFVTKPTDVATGLPAMAQDGEYAPLGPWVVTFMRQADQWNHAEARRLRERLERMNDQRDQRAMDAGDDATEEAASRQYHAGTKAGGGVSEFYPVTIQLVHR
jgi:hypothetical protein